MNLGNPVDELRRREVQIELEFVRVNDLEVRRYVIRRVPTSDSGPPEVQGYQQRIGVAHGPGCENDVLGGELAIAILEENVGLEFESPLSAIGVGHLPFCSQLSFESPVEPV